MKKWLLFLVAAVAVAGFSTASFAAVEGTHHDMATYLGSGDTCYPCHGYKETSAGNASLGTIGSMCYLRCHLGSGGVAGNIPLANYFPERGAFDNGTNTIVISAYTGATTLDKYVQGHRMNPALIPAPDTQTMVTNTGWPYASAASMQCTTCHDVHSNANTPFLRSPLSDNTTRANAFCHKCHAAVANGAARWVDMANAPNGAHPSEADWGNAATRTGNGRLGRTIAFKDPTPAAVGDNSVFRNWSPSGTALNSNANHYNPGGKLGDFATAGNVGCYTCHATHMPSASGLGQLTVVQYKAAGSRTQSDMCVGCHGSVATQGRNPGVTNYFHPVDRETRVVSFTDPANAVYQVTTGSFNIVVDMSNVTDNGVGGQLSCMSCHGDARAANQDGVHNGPAGTKVLSPTKPNCASCHNTATAQMGTAPNSHHVYGGGATRGANYTTWGYPASVSFNATQSANLSDGLSCDDCHPFNTTAHNWN